MQNPVISIIVPVYNVEPWLAPCVDSLLAQDFTDYELILVDDGSPDHCPALCDAYAKKDGRIRVIHKPNGGPASARNAGLDAARGRYIAFVDSDDTVDPRYLSFLHERLTASHCRISSCGARHTDEKGNPVENTVYADQDLLGVQDALLQFYDILRDKGMYAMVLWNKLFDASLFQGLRFDESFYGGDDANLIDRLYEGQKIDCTNEPLYFYRERAGSITAASFNPNTLNDLRLYKSWIDFFASRPEYEDLFQWALARYWQVFYIFYVHAAQAKGLSPTVKARFHKHLKDLRKLLPKILKTPHLPGGEKLRLLLFCLSPALCYGLAASWGKLADGKH